MAEDLPEVNSKPLTQDFYKHKGWIKNLVDFYSEKKVLPRKVLQKPIEILCSNIMDVILINLNWPQDTHSLFKQAVGPLWDPAEYREKIYDSFKKRAIDENEPRLDRIAESLLYIRSLFEQDLGYIEKNLAKEVEMVNGDTKTLAVGLQIVTRAHVNQVIKMLEKR